MEKGRFKYAGGIKLQESDMHSLLSTFSVVIDASGSSTANRLSCPGHEHATEANKYIVDTIKLWTQHPQMRV